MCQISATDRRVAHLELVINNLEQLVEAYGDDNRYFTGLALGHPPNEKEAIEYYLTNGGAVGHRERLVNSPPPKLESET